MMQADVSKCDSGRLLKHEGTSILGMTRTDIAAMVRVIPCFKGWPGKRDTELTQGFLFAHDRYRPQDRGYAP
jgi:hypothetical protein